MPESTQKNSEVSQGSKPSSEEKATQQTKKQESPPIKEEVQEKEDPRADYIASLESRIAEQQIQYRKLENLIESVKETKAAAPPPPRDIEAERNRFYTDPVGSLDEQLNSRDERILNAMRKMLEPLHKVANSVTVNDEYQMMKTYLRSDPVYGRALRDPDIERVVDSVIRQPGITLDENVVKSAIAQAMGMKAMGAIGTSRNNNNENRSSYDPPSIGTTRERIGSIEQQRKELTEDDRLAMRVAGLKPGVPEDEDQYWDLVSPGAMTLDAHKNRS